MTSYILITPSTRKRMREEWEKVNITTELGKVSGVKRQLKGFGS